MQLFQSWIESLRFFLPKNSKPFGMVTLKTIGTTYKVWFAQFWWLLLMPFVMSILFYFPFASCRMSFFVLFLAFYIVASFLTLMSLFLVLRPSTKKKGYDYYLDYTKHVSWIGFFYFVKIIGFYFIFFGGGPFCFYLLSMAHDMFVSLLFLPHMIMFMTPLMMFYFDSKGGFRDLIIAGINTLKMVLYNLPFFIISIIIGFFLSLVTGFGGFINVLFAVVPASFIANFYTKRRRDQSKLYYK